LPVSETDEKAEVSEQVLADADSAITETNHDFPHEFVKQ